VIRAYASYVENVKRDLDQASFLLQEAEQLEEYEQQLIRQRRLAFDPIDVSLYRKTASSNSVLPIAINSEMDPSTSETSSHIDQQPTIHYITENGTPHVVQLDGSSPTDIEHPEPIPVVEIDDVSEIEEKEDVDPAVWNKVGSDYNSSMSRKREAIQQMIQLPNRRWILRGLLLSVCIAMIAYLLVILLVFSSLY
jgi:hypothetical protein